MMNGFLNSAEWNGLHTQAEIQQIIGIDNKKIMHL